MMSRAASNIGKFSPSAPTSVPAENSTTAVTNSAFVGNVRTMNGEVGIATESSSRYPVVNHCTTSAEIENSAISVEYAMFSDVSDRMPRKVSSESATTTTVSLPSLMAPLERPACVSGLPCCLSWMLTMLLICRRMESD